MTSKKMNRSHSLQRTWVTRLDGRDLPEELLRSIIPISNVLAYETARPDKKLIETAEEHKLDLLVRHLGWHDHFKDTHNKYRIPYLLVLQEQSGPSQDPSVFKELLLNWARENLKGFSINNFKGGPGPRKRRPAEDLAFLVDLFVSRKTGNVAERCKALAKNVQRKPRTLQNRFARISVQQLSRWLQSPRLRETEQEAIAWAMAAKRQSSKKQSRKSATL